MKKADPCIAITSGEPAGIGPEIIASIDTEQFGARLVVIGDRDLIESRSRAVNPALRFTDYQQNRDSAAKGCIEILHIPLCEKCNPGVLNKANASYVLKMLTRACEGCLNQ